MNAGFLSACMPEVEHCMANSQLRSASSALAIHQGGSNTAVARLAQTPTADASAATLQSEAAPMPTDCQSAAPIRLLLTLFIRH